MEQSTPAPAWHHRLGGWLNDHRPAIILELLLFTAIFLAPIPLVTVPLLLFGWLSLRLRRLGWVGIGLQRPASWPRVIALGVVVGLGYQVISIWLVAPLLQNLLNQSIDLSQFADLPGNLGQLILWLVLAWLLAGFGEEMVYRGYLLNRLVDLWPGQSRRWLLSALVSAALFGLAHIYQGWVGVIETGLSGLVFALVYLATGRNLWPAIIAHGVFDTLAFYLIYLGLYPMG